MTKHGFEIIPVIDVKAGAAVRAVAGERASYRPLATMLASCPDPVAVAAGYRELFPFRTLYVADLDGIEGAGPQKALQARVRTAWGGREVWIDDGGTHEFSDDGVETADAGSLCRTRLCHVLGSESLSSNDMVLAPAASVLSLDFRGDTFAGPRELLDDSTLWPERVIVMTLARVGMDAGPDLSRINDIVRRAGPERYIYAAGGVRDPSDLVHLRAAGAAGALVASALHAGKIKTGDLEEIAGR
jgi:phosphoribosylformimino-5-aminoimidazole carboxamide ribotide isomerase